MKFICLDLIEFLSALHKDVEGTFGKGVDPRFKGKQFIKEYVLSYIIKRHLPYDILEKIHESNRLRGAKILDSPYFDDLIQKLYGVVRLFIPCEGGKYSLYRLGNLIPYGISEPVFSMLQELSTLRRVSVNNGIKPFFPDRCMLFR